MAFIVRFAIVISVLICLQTCVLWGKEHGEPNELRYAVYHKLPHHSKYLKRGEVVVTLSRAVAKYYDTGDVLSINEFENADKTNNDPYYLIKLVDEQNPKNVMESFTKMCLLKASKFEDEIIIHLNGNNAFHFDYYTSIDQCNSTSVLTSQTANFKTIIQIIKPVNGARAMPIREDGTVEKPPEEKSFLQKY
ncbi:1238_t:CDS:2, partial [Cetraspora pellucida]